MSMEGLSDKGITTKMAKQCYQGRMEKQGFEGRIVKQCQDEIGKENLLLCKGKNGI